MGKVFRSNRLINLFLVNIAITMTEEIEVVIEEEIEEEIEVEIGVEDLHHVDPTIIDHP